MMGYKSSSVSRLSRGQYHFLLITADNNLALKHRRLQGKSCFVGVERNDRDLLDQNLACGAVAHHHDVDARLRRGDATAVNAVTCHLGIVAVDDLGYRFWY